MRIGYDGVAYGACSIDDAIMMMVTAKWLIKSARDNAGGGKTFGRDREVHVAQQQNGSQNPDGARAGMSAVVVTTDARASKDHEHAADTC